MVTREKEDTVKNDSGLHEWTYLRTQMTTWGLFLWSLKRKEWCGWFSVLINIDTSVYIIISPLYIMHLILIICIFLIMQRYKMANEGVSLFTWRPNFSFIAHVLQTSSGWIALSYIILGHKESMTEQNSPEIIIIKGKINKCIPVFGVELAYSLMQCRWDPVLPAGC